MPENILVWNTLIAGFAPLFTEPTSRLFAEMIVGWVLCPGRHTVTRIYQIAEPEYERSHDEYHRFFPDAAWILSELWRHVGVTAVNCFHPTGPIPVDLDDTVFHKAGRKVDGAGWWRDAVHSTGTKVVHCFGLNLIVLTLRVNPPWGGEPLGLPLNMRLHRKKEESLLKLAMQMLTETAMWFPGRHFIVSADGFFAPLAGEDFFAPRKDTTVPKNGFISRMRRDAAIFDLPKMKRIRRKGRPAKKGKRLPTPEELAQRCRKWKRVKVNMRGREVLRLVAEYNVLWYHVCKTRPVKLVITRDPDGTEPDDFFFTTDVELAAEVVIAQYSGRWSIEDTFRNTKQFIGGQDPQTWKINGPERAAAFAFIVYSLTWIWFIQAKKYRKTCWPSLPWYSSKSTPSFQDALAGLRSVLWRSRLLNNSEKTPLLAKNMNAIFNVLAYAA
ncbi:MAG: transposase [Planctomycetota bacterium]